MYTVCTRIIKLAQFIFLTNVGKVTKHLTLINGSGKYNPHEQIKFK